MVILLDKYLGTYYYKWLEMQIVDLSYAATFILFSIDVKSFFYFLYYVEARGWWQWWCIIYLEIGRTRTFLLRYLVDTNQLSISWHQVSCYECLLRYNLLSLRYTLYLQIKIDMEMVIAWDTNIRQCNPITYVPTSSWLVGMARSRVKLRQTGSHTE